VTAGTMSPDSPTCLKQSVDPVQSMTLTITLESSMCSLQATLAMVLFPISYLSQEPNIIKSTIDLMHHLKAITRDHIQCKRGEIQQLSGRFEPCSKT